MAYGKEEALINSSDQDGRHLIRVDSPWSRHSIKVCGNCSDQKPVTA